MKSAVLVIDVQNGIFAAERQPYNSTQVVSHINKLIAHAKAAGHLVIFIQHQMPGMVEYGSQPWQLFSELTVDDEDIRISKTAPNAFFETELEALLDQHDIHTLTLCGYSSDFCIDRTAFEAAAKGYRVHLPADAHTTHDKPHLTADKIIEHHNFTLSMHPNIHLHPTRILVSK